MMNFDPFQNRLCREVRNDLSESLIHSIHAGNIGPSRAAVKKYLPDDAAPVIRHYIDNRLTRYRTVLEKTRFAGMGTDDTYAIAILLWNQELFFEVHEWLEAKWHASDGIEKKVIQALVRAAGTYVHLELGRNHSAKKISAKAVESLITYQRSVPDLIDTEHLIEKLKILDPVPPKLGTGALI